MTTTTLLASLLMLALPERGVIAGDLANVRAKPQAGAKIVARFRIGTTVTVLDRNEGWAEVALEIPEFETTTGWVAEGQLASDATDASTAAQRAEAALQGDDVAGALVWWSRAVALDTSNVDRVRAFAKLLRSVHQEARASALEDALAGKYPTYVAFCQNERAELVAIVHPDGHVSSGAFAPGESDREDAILATVRDAAWFGSTPEGSRPLSGTPFSAAHVAEVYEHEPHGRRIVLGPCRDQSWRASHVFATAPFDRLSPLGDVESPVTRRALATILEAYPMGPRWALRSLESARIPDTQVRDVDVLYARDDGQLVRRRALVDRRGALLPCANEEDTACAVTWESGRRHWIRFAWGTRTRLGVAVTGGDEPYDHFEADPRRNDRCGGARGVQLDGLRPDGTLDVLHVALEAWGC